MSKKQRMMIHLWLLTIIIKFHFLRMMSGKLIVVETETTDMAANNKF